MRKYYIIDYLMKIHMTVDIIISDSRERVLADTLRCKGGLHKTSGGMLHLCADTNVQCAILHT